MKNGLLQIVLEGFSENEGGWVGVDLDGTAAHYDGWKGIEHIGEPIPKMIEIIKSYLEQGTEVRIFTARADQINAQETLRAIGYIEQWCLEHVGVVLKVTNVKDSKMIKIYDDRAVTVVENTGEVVEAPEE